MRLCGRARFGFSAWIAWTFLCGIGVAEDAATDPTGAPRRKPSPITITADPLKIEPGKPLSLRALVSEPMQLEGALSWTVETRLHRGALFAYAFSPDDKLLATGGLDGTIRIWDLANGSMVRAMIGHNSYIYDLSWSPDGNSLASAGGWDGTMRVWDIRTGMPLKVFKNPKEYSLWVSWSPDGSKLLGAGGSSGWVWMWDVRAGTETIVLEVGQNVRSIDWSPSGEQLAAAAQVGSVAVYNSSSGKVVQTLGDISAVFYCVRWSPDGTKLACGSTTNTTIYNVEEGKALKELVGAGISAAWSPDGKMLCTSRGSGAATVWDAETGKVVKPIPALGSDIEWRESEMLFSRFHVGSPMATDRSEANEGSHRGPRDASGLEFWPADRRWFGPHEANALGCPHRQGSQDARRPHGRDHGRVLDARWKDPGLVQLRQDGSAMGGRLG